ncbi:MAG: PhzF family phenazine biosynthesis protein [bacterium]
MKIQIYQVDAFTDHLFGGNPAAVCPLETWLSDVLMQQIAGENNLAETAFFVRKNGDYHIRWFTPALEVDLCGHATLASAHVLYNHLGFTGKEIRFDSRSGWLTVKKEGGLLTLDFPADIFSVADPPALLISSLGMEPLEVYKGKTDWMVLLENQQAVENITPDLGMMSRVPGRGVIVTSRGEKADFVSRFFGPQSGVPEDPVTGSAHTTLAPFWGERLGKSSMEALQVSQRRGQLHCTVKGDRVEISGEARTFFTGEITL